MSGRKANLEYTTRETSSRVALALDGSGQADISTGIPFFDHMLEQLAFHGLLDLKIKTSGDLQVDCHHTCEDVGIAIGRALGLALGEKKAIRRFAHAYYPMDETLVRVALDLSGRPDFVFTAQFERPMLGAMETQMVSHFFKSLAANAGMTLHMEVLYGQNDHHKAEGLFKAFARALADAVAVEPRRKGVASTKGSL